MREVGHTLRFNDEGTELDGECLEYDDGCDSCCVNNGTSCFCFCPSSDLSCYCVVVSCSECTLNNTFIRELQNRSWKESGNKIKGVLKKDTESQLIGQYKQKELQSETYSKQGKEYSKWLECNLDHRKTAAILNKRRWYKIKHIPKNRDILENSRYESKQDEYMRLWLKQDYGRFQEGYQMGGNVQIMGIV